MLADRYIWMASTLDGRLEGPTKTFHRKCPGCPNGPGCFDQVSNVEERMNRDWTSSDFRRIMLVVEPNVNLKG